MKRLWAPWRMEYIMGNKQEGCIFCIKEDVSCDHEKLVLYRSPHSFVIMNRYPYTNGHLMIVPYRHTASLDDLDEIELLDLINTIRFCRQILEKACNPQGFNIGMNLGKAAGAGIDEHIHFHIVPRWNGDTNYMSVLADVRVMPEALTDSFDRLKPYFLESSFSGVSE